MSVLLVMLAWFLLTAVVLVALSEWEYRRSWRLRRRDDHVIRLEEWKRRAR